MQEHADRLARTPLGLEMGEQDAKALAALMQPVNVQARQSLCMKGDPSDALYIVLQGAFNVLLDSDDGEDLVVAALGPGGVVGELELMTGAPRMASVVATESSICLKLDAALLRERPADHARVLSRLVDVIAKVLAVRLAAVNDKLLAAWSLQGKTDATHMGTDVRAALDDVWRW